MAVDIQYLVWAMNYNKKKKTEIKLIYWNAIDRPIEFISSTLSYLFI